MSATRRRLRDRGLDSASGTDGRLHSVLLLSALAVLVAASASGQAIELPDTLGSGQPGESRLVWVAATEADRFPPIDLEEAAGDETWRDEIWEMEKSGLHALDGLRVAFLHMDEAEYRAEGCYPFYTQTYVLSRPASFEELARQANYVIRGDVVSSTPGFVMEDVGSLLRIRQAADGQTTPAETFVFYPGGDFEYQGTRICTRRPGYPRLPQAGDQILALVERDPVGEEPRIMMPIRDGVFYETKGTLKLPSRTATLLAGREGHAASTLSLEELADEVHSAITSGSPE